MTRKDELPEVLGVQLAGFKPSNASHCKYTWGRRIGCFKVRIDVLGSGKHVGRIFLITGQCLHDERYNSLEDATHYLSVLLGAMLRPLKTALENIENEQGTLKPEEIERRFQAAWAKNGDARYHHSIESVRLGFEMAMEDLATSRENSSEVREAWTGKIWPGVRWEIELKKTKYSEHYSVELYAVKVGEHYPQALDWMLLSDACSVSWMHNKQDQTLLFDTLADALQYEAKIAESCQP